MNGLPLVYIVKPGDDNPQLRYSLRSLVNLEHGNIWIVGHKPAWLTGVHHIPGNRYSDKPRNVFDNIRIAAEHPDVPDEYVVMNDDFYCLAPYKPRIEYRGLLTDHIASLPNPTTWWAKSLHNTAAWLRQHGINQPLSYELHKPFPTVKAHMAEALAACATHCPANPPQWRSIYGNLWNIGGTQADDCKVYRSNPAITGQPLLSTTRASFALTEGNLSRQFPSPSQHEGGQR